MLAKLPIGRKKSLLCNVPTESER